LLRTDSTRLALEDDADTGVASVKRPSVRLEERHIIACNGDETLRKRVEQLLLAHNATENMDMDPNQLLDLRDFADSSKGSNGSV
jgi:hypothetical protein